MEKHTLINPLFLLLLLLLLSQPVRAQVQQSAAPGLEPSDDSPTGQHFSRPKEVIIVAVLSILLFVTFYFVYLCCCIDDHLLDIRNWSGWQRPWGTFASSFRSKMGRHELDPNVVKSFPTFEYEVVKSSMINKGNLECAVCLMEFHDKDVLRLIPKCDHVFHADCVDDWLINHATCPVCRLNLTNDDLCFHDDDVILEEVEEGGSSRRMRSLSSTSFGRSRLLLGRLSRSLSAGHMAIKQSDDVDKFTLRLPWEVRKKIISGEGRSKSERFEKNSAPSFRKQIKLEDFSTRTSTSLDGSSAGTSVVHHQVETTQLPV